MKAEIPNPFPTRDCLYCGGENAHGLHLVFFWDDELREVTTEYTPTRRFAGQGDILHGAIQMGLVDEIMGWTTVVVTGEMAVTTDLNVRFLRPVYIDGSAVRATCRVLAREAADVRLRADLIDARGLVCMSATGAFRVLSPARFAALVHRSW